MKRKLYPLITKEIVVEVLAGSSFNETSNAAFKLSKKNNCTVTFNFNGKTYKAMAQ